MSGTERPAPPVHARPITVFELIDDIRDKILELHGERLREALKDQRGHAGSDESGDAADDDRPF